MTRKARTGLLMIAGFFLVLYLGVTKPDPFRQSRAVYAMFRNVATLASLDRTVRVGGADVGTIGDVERVGDHARVQLILDDPSIRVTADATAALRPHLAFEGSSFIDLFPGSPSAPPLRDDTIPLSQTTDYVTVDKALRTFSAPTRASIQHDLRRLASDLGEAEQHSVQSLIHDLPRLYRPLASASRAALGVGGTELAGAVQAIAATERAVATQQGRLTGLMRSSERTFAAFVPDGGVPLDQSLAELPSTLTALAGGSRSLQQVAAQLSPVVDSLKPALRRLAPAQRQLRPLLEELRPVLSSATPVLRSLTRALDAGGRAAAPARSLLTPLGPALDQLHSSVLPGLAAKTRLGAPVYDQIFRGMLTGFDGAISVTQTSGEPTSLFGVGPGFRFDATASILPLNGYPPKCGGLPGALQSVMTDLSLCQP